eukprot:CAMPEP_0113946736 /NCGR_PEP_ID=MMETSP1339-20121228/59822_1 /TAXON_ID=94617 /ORGANISM="Fibrocapsa japonica" /LENGTH=173 /DNA_ID=CAMNT_0000952971 /DNA_START=39 /DNA_END=560 /DNA_ORIENTATION=+ /assembly_acc=CAM_ASM_000762
MNKIYRQSFRLIHLRQPTSAFQQRLIHHTQHQKSTALIFGGLGIAVAAYTGKNIITAYKAWKAQQPAEPKHPENAGSGTEGKASEKSEESTSSGFSFSFSSLFKKGYYEGGFELKMTRREAARILGVRESASPQRIKEAHRRILMLNHPDRGGSPYVATKINQAKEILIKGKQ